jgi:predicted amidohydrolase YtcJ
MMKADLAVVNANIITVDRAMPRAQALAVWGDRFACVGRNDDVRHFIGRTDMNGNVWGANQRVSVEEAIKIYTLHGAYASFEEDIKGSIEVGKLADFVVLSEDPTEVPLASIGDISVEKTFVGGKLE